MILSAGFPFNLLSNDQKFQSKGRVEMRRKLHFAARLYVE